MVLKKSKFGGNTGNTIRRGKANNNNNKGSRSGSFISKQSNDNNEKNEEWMENGIENKKNDNSLNTNDRSKLSLNKDKRWLLPEKMKFEVQQKCQKEEMWKQHKQDMTASKKKSHTEGHMNNRKKSSQIGETEDACVAVVEKVTETVDERNKENENKINCFVNSVDVKYNNKSKSCNGPLEISSKIKQQLDVTYTVETSSENTVSETQRSNEMIQKTQKKNSKKFEDYNDEFYDDGSKDHVTKEIEEGEEEQNVSNTCPRKEMTLDMFVMPSGKIKEKRRRIVAENNDEIFEFVNAMDEDFEITDAIDSEREEFEIEDGIYVDEEEYEMAEDFNDGEDDFNTDEIVVPSGCIPSDDSFEITNRFYMPLEDISCENDQGKELKIAAEDLQSNSVNKFECNVKLEHISSSSLLAKFGARYIEGRCLPRRFVIFNAAFEPSGTLMIARVLKEENGVATLRISIINASHNLSSTDEQYCEPDVSDFHLLCESCFPKEETNQTIEKTIQKDTPFQKSIIDDQYKEKTRLIRIKDICREIFALETPDGDESSFYANYYQAICPTCYSTDHLTSMSECPHYACDACWGLYVNGKLLNSDSNCLECPDKDCDKKIDLITIISFLDPKFVPQYITNICKGRVLTSCKMNFCPTPGCESIAVYNNPESENNEDKESPALLHDNGIENNACVECLCKKTWCFSCQGPEHWPSACHADKVYQVQRKKDLIFDMTVDIKDIEFRHVNCPQCSHPITKKGGDNRMTCTTCKFIFCYGCVSKTKFGHIGKCTSETKDVSETRNGNDVRVPRKAFEFSSKVRKAETLKRKLRIDITYSRFSQTDLTSNALVSSSSRAVMLLVSGYRLLENLSVANAVCRSRNTRTRVIRFIDMFSFVLGLLETSIDVNGIDEINISNVKKNIEYVESSLENLSSIGLQKSK